MRAEQYVNHSHFGSSIKTLALKPQHRIHSLQNMADSKSDPPMGWAWSNITCSQCDKSCGLICVKCHTETHFLKNRGWYQTGGKKWWCIDCLASSGYAAETVHPDWLCTDCQISKTRQPEVKVSRMMVPEQTATCKAVAKASGYNKGAASSYAPYAAAMQMAEVGTDVPGDSIDTWNPEATVHVALKSPTIPQQTHFKAMKSWKQGCSSPPPWH